MVDWRSDAGLNVLQSLIEEPRLGIVTALEGTICPVTDDVEGSRVSPRCRTLLAGLAERLPLVGVISARPAIDMRVRVGLAGLVYAGNRGLEIWRAGRIDVAPEAAAFRQALEAAVSALYSHAQLDPRLHLEDAGSAVFVHFRQGSDVATIRPLVQDIADQQGLRVFEGRTAFELRPPMLVDKGRALCRLVEDHRLSALIYVGDDAADLDAFAMTHTLRAEGTVRLGATVGVSAPSTPDSLRGEADLLVDGIPGVEALLGWLLEARRRWIKAQEEVESQSH